MFSQDILQMNALNTVNPLSRRKKKQKIPVAFREQIWIRDYGKQFQGKCPTRWCQNVINVFDFQSGHNIPESKGGPTIPDNLIPLCSRCNMSMGDRYTFTQWSALNSSLIPLKPQPQVAEAMLPRFFCC